MINRKSTNLDIGLQSSTGIEGHLNGLMHHFHLPHHKVQLKKSFLGGRRWVVRGLIRSEKR